MVLREVAVQVVGRDQLQDGVVQELESLVGAQGQVEEGEEGGEEDLLRQENVLRQEERESERAAKRRASE